MANAKSLGLKQLVSKCKVDISRAQKDAKFLTAGSKHGKLNKTTGYYTAPGWGVFEQNGLVYWRTNCSYNLAYILKSNYRGASYTGQCPQGPQYLIAYVG